LLRHLQIRDFAIIDALELEFAPGMTVLTGETGAGKSIMVDALELLAGGRAGADWVRAGCERADVTATFDISSIGGELRQLLEEQSIPGGSELLLRRVIGTDGRSRAWLNGQGVPLQLLRSVAEMLIDIHGQHEFQSLIRPATQRALVDHFGQNEMRLNDVNVAYSAWHALLERSLQLEGLARDRDARLDLLRYQVQELDALQLLPGELAALVEERSRVSHRSKLATATQTALDGIYEAEPANAYSMTARALSALRTVAPLDAKLAALLAPLDEASIALKETAQSLTHYLDSLELDAGRQENIEKRLAAMEELGRKHRVPIDELPVRHDALRVELAALESAATDLATVRTRQAAALTRYHELARALSSARATSAKRLARDVSARMQELGMAGGRFVAEVEPLPEADPAPHGIDQVTFLVTTNPGQPLRALAKVASGGELARLSLAVQVACAADAAPCMVFDEVDAGIGGAVAEIVGQELRSLGEGRQVLCVTHLPQVASQGHQHLRVSKVTDGRITRTQVTTLSGDARVGEISRMLGGVEVTARARAHAHEMLERAAAPFAARSLAAGTGRKAPKSVP
jgi:DNA repair protein RecN (Recombination protein N)